MMPDINKKISSSDHISVRNRIGGIKDSPNLKRDVYMAVVNLPDLEYDEIFVTIDSKHLEIYANSFGNNRLLGLFDEAYQQSHTYNSKLLLPEHMDIESAEAFYNKGVITVYIPYLS